MKNALLRVSVWQGFVLVVVGVLCVLLIVPLSVVDAADYPLLTSQINIGERGSSVSNLQSFLSANSAIYPEGLITGYYGPLTQAAVARFQAQYGIPAVGRVGPLTLTKINSIISSGGWSSASTDISGPWIYAVNQSIASNSATFTWNTNELANGKIFFFTQPITMNEGDINSVGFGSTNGFIANNDGVARMSQQVVVNGLQPNTRYYYVLVSTDLAGNVSVWNPNTTFTTSNQ